MSILARATGAAALALLLLPAAGRAELTPSRLKQVYLDASFEGVGTNDQDADLFVERIALKGKPSCILVRYSGEIIGSDGDGDGRVSAVFSVRIDDAIREPQPSAHQATTSILPQIVAFSAFACDLPAGDHEVAVSMRASGPGDHVGAVFRNLEIWTERASPPAAGQARPFLKARRAFVASSEESVTARVDPAALFHEGVVLKPKSSCLLVRYSGEVLGSDGDGDGYVSMTFAVRIGSEVPPHPSLFDLTASEQPQIVTFSAFRCGLEPGPYDIQVQAESADDDDPVETRFRVLEVFTESGYPAPAVDSPVGAELAPMKPRRTFLASSSEEVVASGKKDLFRERVVLKGPPGCLVVAFSGEIAGTDGDLDVGDEVLASFEIVVGDAFPIAPVFQEVPTGLPRLVSLSGHACDLPAGAYDVNVGVRAEGPGDQVTVGARTLEIWTESGRVAPPTIGLVPAD